MMMIINVINMIINNSSNIDRAFKDAVFEDVVLDNNRNLFCNNSKCVKHKCNNN